MRQGGYGEGEKVLHKKSGLGRLWWLEVVAGLGKISVMCSLTGVGICGIGELSWLERVGATVTLVRNVYFSN